MRKEYIAKLAALTAHLSKPKVPKHYITDKDIKTAKAFAKVHAMINVPLKRKPMTAEVVQRRAIRGAKLWAKMFAYRLG